MTILLAILFWLAQKVAERLLIPVGKWFARKYRAWRDKHLKSTSTQEEGTVSTDRPDVSFSLIPEHKVEGKRLGRHQEQADPRDLRYLAEGATTLVSVTHAAVGLPLNQGDVGSCTANALCGALNSAPLYGARTFTEADALTLYKRETLDEGYPYPQFDIGGTGRAVCKAAKELGWISSYQNAIGLQAALQALVLRPIIVGCKWYTSFDTPLPDGTVAISPTATVRGGHEIVADELDVENYRVGFWNSWGTGYGVGGRFYMSWHCLWTLLNQGGDVKVPIV